MPIAAIVLFGKKYIALLDNIEETYNTNVVLLRLYEKTALVPLKTQNTYVFVRTTLYRVNIRKIIHKGEVYNNFP